MPGWLGPSPVVDSKDSSESKCFTVMVRIIEMTSSKSGWICNPNLCAQALIRVSVFAAKRQFFNTRKRICHKSSCLHEGVV